MTTDLRELFPDTQGLDEKSSRALLHAIKKNYENGQFDYIKFKQSVHSLAKLDMSVETSYKSSFATAATLGLTKEGLLKSANKYIYALESERESFAEAILDQKRHKIDGRKSQVADLLKKIEEHKIKIQELEREILIFQNKLDTVDQDVESAKTKIEDTKNKFFKVYDVIENDIKADIELITKYLYNDN